MSGTRQMLRYVLAVSGSDVFLAVFPTECTAYEALSTYP